MKKLSFLFCLLLIPGSSLLAEEESERVWKKVTDKNDIQVYMSHQDDSKFKTFRGVTTINHDDIRVLEAMLEDTESMASWLHLISRVSLVEKHSVEYRELYVETRLPWPIKDRDSYVDITMEQRDDYSIMLAITETENSPPPAKGYVRIPDVRGYVFVEAIEGVQDMRVTFEVILDPGVYYVPAWVINMLLSDVPYFSLKKLKRVAKQEKYQDYDKSILKRRPWVAGE